jgi:hypothetical protein
VSTAQVAEQVLENPQEKIQDLYIALEWFVKTVPNNGGCETWSS